MFQCRTVHGSCHLCLQVNCRHCALDKSAIITQILGWSISQPFQYHLIQDHVYVTVDLKEVPVCFACLFNLSYWNVW